MIDLIRRQDAIEAVGTFSRPTSNDHAPYEYAWVKLLALPNGDDRTYCKDCVEHRNRTGYCDIWKQNTDADGYCYRGRGR